jgi:xylose isomerase
VLTGSEDVTPSPARYRFATRLNSFRRPGAQALGDLVRAVAGIPGLTALELNYPQHVAGLAPREIPDIVRDTGLALTALSLRFEGPQFALGAFTHPSPDIRHQAIRLAQDAVDLAAELDVPHVNLWMAHDGFDMPFEADYAELWQLEVEGFRMVADHNPDILVSVEYKPVEPRRVSLVASMADALLAVRDVGRPNFGVQIDFCHSLMARERPAAAAARALAEGRLFGVHLNDGYGPTDDGLPVAGVHLWETLELLWYLRIFGYRGTIYFDTFPERVDPRSETAHNIAVVQQLDRLLDQLPGEELRSLQRKRDSLEVTRLIRSLVLEMAE